MAGKHGDALGVDLGTLWYAGQHDLPNMAADYADAWAHAPYAVSASTRRGGGLGTDPGGQLDLMCDRVNKFLKDSENVCTDVGAALVWIADNYAATDDTCKRNYEKTKDHLEETIGG